MTRCTIASFACKACEQHPDQDWHAWLRTWSKLRGLRVQLPHPGQSLTQLTPPTNDPPKKRTRPGVEEGNEPEQIEEILKMQELHGLDEMLDDWLKYCTVRPPAAAGRCWPHGTLAACRRCCRHREQVTRWDHSSFGPRPL